MRLWLVTCPDDFAGEYDDIEEMFKRGLTRLILDKKGRNSCCRKFGDVDVAEESVLHHGFGCSSRVSFDDYERWLMSLPMEFRDRIWVRGTPDVAEQLDVRGCVCEARSFMGAVPESWKRVNCVAICDCLDEVEMLPEWVAGALVGPILQPLSALEPCETLDAEFVRETLGKSRVPVILWGGADTDTLDAFKSLNPAGIASLGGVWNYADPVNAFIKLNRAVQGTINN